MEEKNTFQVPLPNWITIRVSGKDRTKYLDGIITINLNKINGGVWYRSFLLTPHGKIKSVFWLMHHEEAYYLITSPHYKEKLIEDLLRFNINVEVKLEDVTQERPNLAYKVGTHQKLGETKDPLGQKGAFWWEDRLENPMSYEDYQKEFSKMGVIPIDKVDNFNPLEIGFSDSVHIDKGCFLGQEPISRLFHRGTPRYISIQLISNHPINFDQIKVERVFGVNEDGSQYYYTMLIKKKLISDFEQIGKVTKIGSYSERQNLNQ